MTERKLTPQEIDELHEYCYFRSVWHYDVQVELVDHLASAIENLWEKNPTLSFEDALDLVGEQFGGSSGFLAIRKEKEKALRKNYWRLLWQFVGDYYKFPKIMFTLVLTLGLNLAFRFSENDQWVMLPIAAMLVGLSIFYRHYYFSKFVEVKTTADYPFLLNEIAHKGIITTPAGLFGVAGGLVLNPHHFSTTLSIFFSFLISLYLILLYGDYFYLPQRIRGHLSEQFPQFVKS